MRTMLPAEDHPGDGSEPTDITAFQKMLSATTGSLLTGLTSMAPHNKLDAERAQG